MHNFRTAFFAALVFGTSLIARADSVIPYGNVGHIAAQEPLVAIATSEIFGYFVSASAGHNDVVRMIDVTQNWSSNWFFPNHSTALGASADFGSVNAGDELVFQIQDLTTDRIYGSEAAFSSDGANHAYSQMFDGGLLDAATFPAGVYIGMEDLAKGGSDWDYNDDTFLFTNTALDKSSPSAPPAVSEPGSLALFGTGMLGTVGLIRRRFFN
ncbi:PEP-CTERM sorting domain-containing protein [Edaphobacter aggregans]|uniref:PEP-CTERM sorting domain-containing protein n=1 Tax=Edaphobacter aggregans TaxID=570835 RepID=UPI0005592225|nr:PEP-CTERM sorting domain-containing protein [Edaphobacter aggregans]